MNIACIKSFLKLFFKVRGANSFGFEVKTNIPGGNLAFTTPNFDTSTLTIPQFGKGVKLFFDMDRKGGFFN